ncbi:MAG TPA: divalent metal cation transporter, partial [Bacteroidetes bacterium]|nr:divalent metal cation transporter [Bacteroidota bacterium]
MSPSSTGQADGGHHHFLKSLGPGLIWAGAAIGVSHLVQSTRAGARFGFALVVVVLLANLLKYPFFEFGPRYAAATGENLLEGYRRLGRWTLWLYFALTVGTMFTVEAAVTVVCAGLAAQLFGVTLTPVAWSAILIATCALLLVFGRYPLLDSAMKGIIIVLAVSTIIAVTAALLHGPAEAPGFQRPPLWDLAGISFIVALVGWMPSAIDISVWHSIWTLERRKQTGHAPSLRHALLDFNIGYFG